MKLFLLILLFFFTLFAKMAHFKDFCSDFVVYLPDFLQINGDFERFAVKPLTRISHQKSAVKPGSTVSPSLQSQKHSRHTNSMPASAFGTVPRGVWRLPIHSTFRLFATIPVRNVG